MELRQGALSAFSLINPIEKCRAVAELWTMRSQLVLDSARQLSDPGGPGRPQRPSLVDPKAVPRRSPHTAKGHAALIHSVAHIEFNAIALALDAIWRFSDMPSDYYSDWLKVAQEESTHFLMLLEHLERLGYTYGDFEAHDGLWTMCERTAHDVCERMALVPRTMEARGLDATPLIQDKLRKVATPDAMDAVAILGKILEDEVGHVAIGNYWYEWICSERGIDAQSYFNLTAQRHGAPKLRAPLNITARQAAGFSANELAGFLQINQAQLKLEQL